jgi:AcrR family transcriptional regulator
MPRAGLTTETVVSAAADLADEVGLSRLTLAAVADRLGVRLPSLYKHIGGMPALQRALAVRAKAELAQRLAKATSGKSNGNALIALASAYREWAYRHPGKYAASLAAPAADDPDDQAASTAVVEAVYDALHGYGLADVAMVDAVRSLRAVIHGYVMLEQSGGFGLDRPVDASLDWALASLDRAMTQAAPEAVRR